MMIRILGRIITSALTFVAFVKMAEGMEHHCPQEIWVNSIWTMTVDLGHKPLFTTTPFLTFESNKESQIVKIRFDISPRQPAVANLFSDDQHQHDSDVGAMSHSSLCLSVKASNDDALNKAKGIIDSINTQIQTNNDIKKEQQKACYEEAESNKNLVWDKILEDLNSKSHESGSDSIDLRLHDPFRIPTQQQPQCFFAFLYIHEYKYIRDFIERFQNVFPELRSEVLDEWYSELSRRISRII